jgi:hypothetical protein
MSQPKQKSSVRHTRAIRVAQSKHLPAAPLAAPLQARLRELVLPATYAQLSYFRQLGLRARLLTLPVMVALVISLIWQQVGSASELVRMLAQEGILWVEATRLSQQAFSQRLLTFPAVLFERVLLDVLPLVQQRWTQRQRPLPTEVVWAHQHFGRLLIFDGSTLDVLWRKLKALREVATPPLAGRMGTLLDLASRLPVRVWYESDAQSHDLQFSARLLSALRARDLLVLDAGFRDYGLLAQLTDALVSVITRPARNLAYQVERVLQRSTTVHDQIVQLGRSKNSPCHHPMRLIVVLFHGQCYRYLTNVLDPQVLSAEQVVLLYRRRWRIEVAFLLVKRLLGLAYLWVGSENGVQLQVWASWLLYTLLIDLSDAVADELNVLFDAISVEMVFRGLYHFTQAYQRATADEPIHYLASHATELAILKRVRKPKPIPLLLESA